MKPLGEWIRDRLAEIPRPTPPKVRSLSWNYESGMRDGYFNALSEVLKELKVREDAERERVNENVKELDRYAGEVLDEKEGGTE